MQQIAEEIHNAEVEIVRDACVTYGVTAHSVVLVRRSAPTLVRARGQHSGERCWRVGARIGTRIGPMDPRSAVAVAADAARREKAGEAEERAARANGTVGW